MKHSTNWYIKAHDILAGAGLVATIIGVIVACGLLEVL